MKTPVCVWLLAWAAASTIVLADLAPQPDRVSELIVRGRAQFHAGEWSLAAATFAEAEKLAPENEAVRRYNQRLGEKFSELAERERARSRVEMISEVARAWKRPATESVSAKSETISQRTSALGEKLAQIQVPTLQLTSVDLRHALETLATIARSANATPSHGVNFVLLDPSGANPPVSLSVRELPLGRVLELLTESIGYEYEIAEDAVIVRPSTGRQKMETAVFAISRGAILRMTSAVLRADQTAASESESQQVRRFFQSAGIVFDATPGSSLIYDGAALIVTQTAGNLSRMRELLRRYTEARQVEIEAKFMDVQEGVLEELGISWAAVNSSGQQRYTGANRSLAEAFAGSTSSGGVRIVRPSEAILDASGNIVGNVPALNINEPNVPPSFPGQVDLAAAAGAAGLVTGVVGEFDVSATIRALSRKKGADLLSAPKVMVLSGNEARITVAQELRYPQSYGEIRSEVGRGDSTAASSSAGVTITAATPRDFTTRNVGVELRVTPTVEADDFSISLDLSPRVTEFEGFVEYGGPSIAISGRTTATLPSGFYQPIFSVREVSTRVTVWHGATLVMGGLTREEAKKVHDKVPVLGDLPALGRLFRSKGETTAKRNLLIFVTANLVTPSGAPKSR